MGGALPMWAIALVCAGIGGILAAVIIWHAVRKTKKR
jgi:hypothetical protein